MLGKFFPLKTPTNPKSNFAVLGFYLYDNEVIVIAKEVNLSAHGELEIKAIDEQRFDTGQLNTKVLERGTTWLDTGTTQTLHAVPSYVEIIEERQGDKTFCLE